MTAGGDVGKGEDGKREGELCTFYAFVEKDFKEKTIEKKSKKLEKDGKIINDSSRCLKTKRSRQYYL